MGRHLTTHCPPQRSRESNLSSGGLTAVPAWRCHCRRGYVRALEDAVAIVDEAAFPIDTADRQQMLNIVNSCIGTKFTMRFGNLIAVRRGKRGLCMVQGWTITTETVAEKVHEPSVCEQPQLLFLGHAAARMQGSPSASCPALTPAPPSPFPLQELALDAVQAITVDHGEGRREIDIKWVAPVACLPACLLAWGLVARAWPAVAAARLGEVLPELATICPHSSHPASAARRKYAKVEKIPGGDIQDSRVLKGVMFEKDVVVPARMRRCAACVAQGLLLRGPRLAGTVFGAPSLCGSRRHCCCLSDSRPPHHAFCSCRKIHNPRVLLMDCPLEYKKGENQTNVELMKEEDWWGLPAAAAKGVQH